MCIRDSPHAVQQDVDIGNGIGVIVHREHLEADYVGGIVFWLHGLLKWEFYRKGAALSQPA